MAERQPAGPVEPGAEFAEKTEASAVTVDTLPSDSGGRVPLQLGSAEIWLDGALAQLLTQKDRRKIKAVLKRAVKRSDKAAKKTARKAAKKGSIPKAGKKTTLKS